MWICSIWQNPFPPSTEAFRKIAQSHGVTILVSLFERRTAGVYHNSIVVLDEQGEMAGLYRKMHIPDDPAYYEKFYLHQEIGVFRPSRRLTPWLDR
ncbi:MAG: nitrilase-related carbon-nitrogen hydrolase [Nitrospirales bacterium]|nr:hypothetical protein [Nitrospirales bacterium]